MLRNGILQDTFGMLDYSPYKKAGAIGSILPFFVIINM